LFTRRKSKRNRLKRNKGERCEQVGGGGNPDGKSVACVVISANAAAIVCDCYEYFSEQLNRAPGRPPRFKKARERHAAAIRARR